MQTANASVSRVMRRSYGQKGVSESPIATGFAECNRRAEADR
jgi:hypothetical protein